MYKQEFLEALRHGLSGLPQDEIEERLTFYSEMIDDRMEESLSEAEAVEQIGSVEEIVAQIRPQAKAHTESPRASNPLRVWEIVLIVLGAPIWLSLLIAVVSIVFSVLITVGALLISLWAVAVSIAAAAVGAIAAVVICVLSGRIIEGICIFGAALICAGASIFLFFGGKEATKGIVWLGKKGLLGIKSLTARKENG